MLGDPVGAFGVDGLAIDHKTKTFAVNIMIAAQSDGAQANRVLRLCAISIAHGDFVQGLRARTLWPPQLWIGNSAFRLVGIGGYGAALYLVLLRRQIISTGHVIA